VDAALTTRLTSNEWLRLPLVPVIVRLYFPGAVLEGVVTVRMLVPEPLGTGFVLKVAFAPAGSPPTLRLTLPAKPFDGVRDSA
jgi:hypothetical protein